MEVVVGGEGGEGERREGMWKKEGGGTKAKLTQEFMMIRSVSVCWGRGRGTES